MAPCRSLLRHWRRLRGALDRSGCSHPPLPPGDAPGNVASTGNRRGVVEQRGWIPGRGNPVSALRPEPVAATFAGGKGVVGIGRLLKRAGFRSRPCPRGRVLVWRLATSPAGILGVDGWLERVARHKLRHGLSARWRGLCRAGPFRNRYGLACRQPVVQRMTLGVLTRMETFETIRFTVIGSPHHWEMGPLVEQAEESLGSLSEGECYHLVIPGVLGGAYAIE